MLLSTDGANERADRTAMEFRGTALPPVAADRLPVLRFLAGANVLDSPGAHVIQRLDDLGDQRR